MPSSFPRASRQNYYLTGNTVFPRVSRKINQRGHLMYCRWGEAPLGLASRGAALTATGLPA